MIENPDPSKYRIKKLRNGKYILVDIAVLRWRKRKPLITFTHRPKLGRPKQTRKTYRNFFE